MQAASGITAKTVQYVLQKVNYEALNKALYQSRKFPERPRKVVLFEYIHSGIDSHVALEERVPGTGYSVHSIVTTLEFKNIMNNLFMVDDSVIYNHRKIADGELSNMRQVVLRFEPMDLPNLIPVDPYEGMPGLIQFDPYVNMPPLIPIN
jgi:hypothetical protein